MGLLWSLHSSTCSPDSHRSLASPRRGTLSPLYEYFQKTAGLTWLELSLSFVFRNTSVLVIDGNSCDLAKVDHHDSCDFSTPETIVVVHLVNVSCAHEKGVHYEDDLVLRVPWVELHDKVRDYHKTHAWKESYRRSSQLWPRLPCLPLPYMYIWMRHPISRERNFLRETSYIVFKIHPLLIATTKLTMYIS